MRGLIFEHLIYGYSALSLAIFVLALPIISIVRLVRLVRWQRRREAGRCLTCGYRLTGNVSGICPECGTTT